MEEFSMAGLLRYTLAQWEFQNSYQPQSEEDGMLRTGRMWAYADVLQQLTGKRDAGYWRDVVSNLPEAAR